MGIVIMDQMMRLMTRHTAEKGCEIIYSGQKDWSECEATDFAPARYHSMENVSLFGRCSNI